MVFFTSPDTKPSSNITFNSISKLYNETTEFNLNASSNNMDVSFNYTISDNSIATIGTNYPVFTKSINSSTDVPRGGITGIAMSADRTKLILSEYYNQKVFYSTYNTTDNKWNNPTVITNSDGSGNYMDCALSQNGNIGVAITRYSNTTPLTYGKCYSFIWDASNNRYSSFKLTSDTNLRLYNGVDITSDGTKIVASAFGYVYFATWNTTNNTFDVFTQSTNIISGAVNGIGMSSDGLKIVYCNTSNVVKWSSWNSSSNDYNTGTSITGAVSTARKLRFYGHMILYSVYGNSNTSIQYSTWNASSSSYNSFLSVSKTIIPESLDPWVVFVDSSGNLYTCNTGNASSTEQIIYKSSIINSSNTVTITGKVGETIITAYQSETTNYKLTQKTATLTVTKPTPYLSSFTILDKTYGIDSSFNLTAPTSTNLESGGTFSYSYTSDPLNPDIISIDGSNVTIYKAGKIRITATQAATANYESASIYYDLIINKATPLLTSFTIESKTYGIDSSFNLSEPTSSNTEGGTFSYSYTSDPSNPDIISIEGSNVRINKSGTIRITATQAATANYESASIYYDLIINKATPLLTSFTIESKTYGIDSSFNLSEPTSSNTEGGTFSYSYTSDPSNPDIISIEGSNVRINKSGTIRITATQAATANYESASIYYDLIINKATPSLISFTILDKTYGIDSSFNLTAPTSTNLESGGTFSYTSDPLNPDIISIDGSEVTIYKAGTIKITATQAATANYESASIYYDLIINKATPLLTSFTIESKTYGIDSSFNLSEPTSTNTESGGTFSYSYTSDPSNPDIISIDGSNVTIYKAGTIKITATQAATANYESASIYYDLIINKAIPSLTAFTIPNKTYGNTSFDLTAPNSSNTEGGTFSYTSDPSKPDIVSIDGSNVTILKAGTIRITATQAATANYESATIYYELTINKATPLLTSFTIESKTYGIDSSFNLTAPNSSNTESEGTFSYTSDPLKPGIVLIDGSTVTILKAETIRITATQADTANYESASIYYDLIINKAIPLLSSFTILDKTYGIDSSFNLTAPTSTNLESGGTFSYTSDPLNPDIISIDGSEVTIYKAGTIKITATQAATANYESASIYYDLIINKATPLLTSFTIESKTYGDDSSFNLSAPTSTNLESGGTFSYTSDPLNPDIISIDGSEVTIYKAGTIRITATQAATDNYESATISYELTINKGTPLLSSFTIQDKTYGIDSSFNLSAPTSTNTESEGTFSYTSDPLNPDIISIDGSNVTIYKAGKIRITATQAATANYDSASIDFDLTINKAPTLINELPNIVTTYSIDLSFNLNPESDRIGEFEFISSNTDVATISGNTLIIKRAETITLTTITVNQEESTNYLEGLTTFTLIVNKAPILINNFNDIITTYSIDLSFNLNPTSYSDGAYTYTIDDDKIAYISGNTLKIKEAGSTKITAVQAETTNYYGSFVTSNIIVEKAIPTIYNFNDIIKAFNEEPFYLEPTSNSYGLFTYKSSNKDIADISGNLVIIKGAGSTTISATISATVNYFERTVTIELNVGKILPTISDFVNIIETYNDEKVLFELTKPVTNSEGTFSYESSNTKIVTIYNNSFIIIGHGTALITATQAATDNYLEGVISCSIEINKAEPIINNFNDITKTFGDPDFNLIEPISNSNGLFHYSILDNTYATISGNLITIVRAGLTKITLVQEATANYKEITVERTLTIKQREPVLNNIDIESSENNYQVNLNTTSDGLISYSSSNTEVATINENIITIHDPGTGPIEITATLDETINYLPKIIKCFLTLNPVMPIISNFNNITKKYGDKVFSLIAPVSNSTGFFTYESSNTEVATINENIVTIVGAGLAEITARQSQTIHYLEKSITCELKVKKIHAIISDFEDITKKYGDAVFDLNPNSTNKDGAFTYESSNKDIADISGNSVIIKNAGLTTITATQAETPNYFKGTISCILTINKIKPIIYNFNNIIETYNNEKVLFELTKPDSTNSEGTFSYESSDTKVVTIYNNSFIIIGQGIATITATQAATDNYLEDVISCSIEIKKASPIINNFNDITKTFGDPDFNLIEPTSNSNGLFHYSILDNTYATISGNLITIVKAGSTKIKLVQEATANYEEISVERTLTIKQREPVLNNNIGIGSSENDYQINLNTTSDALLKYSSSNTEVATIDENKVTILNTGFTEITATQDETINYLPKIIKCFLTLNRVNPIISNFNNITKKYGDKVFSLNAPVSNSTGFFTYESSNTEVATINENIVTIVGAGLAEITARQSQTIHYLEKSITCELKVKKIHAIITNFEDITKKYGDTVFDLNPNSTNKDGAFTYESSNKDIADISGNSVIIKNAGLTTITATQAESVNYFKGTISCILTINKITPIISDFVDIIETYDDEKVLFELTKPHSTNSEGTFSYESSETKVVTIYNNSFIIIGCGTATITATQSATDNYLEHVISCSIEIKKAEPIINNFNDITKTFGDPDFNLIEPTSNSDGLFHYSILNNTYATISGNLITIVGAGSTTIRLVQEATANYEQKIVERTLTIKPCKPVLNNNIGIESSENDYQINLNTTSDGLISYSSSNDKATINENKVTILDQGTIEITATQLPRANYLQKIIKCFLTLNRVMPIISNFNNIIKNYDDKPFSLIAPASNSTGFFTYESSDTKVATINKNIVTIVGAGLAFITARQSETIHYFENTITCELKINKIKPIISNFENRTKKYGDAIFDLSNPDSTSIGAFTYKSSNKAIADISGNSVIIKGAGLITITATQAESDNYSEGTITCILTITKITPIISDFVDIIETYNDEKVLFELTKPNSSSEGIFSYESSDTKVVTIYNNSFIIIGHGTAKITATQAESSNHLQDEISCFLTINKAIPIINNFNDITKTFNDEPFNLIEPTSNSDGLFHYSILDNTFATISGDSESGYLITIVGAGSTKIKLVQEASANYEEITVERTLTIKQCEPVLNNIDIESSENIYQVNVNTNSDGLFLYSSSNTEVATIDENKVTILKPGPIEITATQLPSVNYLQKIIKCVLTLNRVVPIISNFNDIIKTYEDKPFSLIAPTSNSTGFFTYESSNTEVAIIYENIVTIIGPGKAIITATQAESIYYFSNTTTCELTVKKANPKIVNFNDLVRKYKYVMFKPVNPTSNSSGDFTYSSSNVGVASIFENYIIIVGAGVTTITATQAETYYYNSGSISCILTVNRDEPIISNVITPDTAIFRSNTFTNTYIGFTNVSFKIGSTRRKYRRMIK